MGGSIPNSQYTPIWGRRHPIKNRVFRCNVSRTKPYYPPANVQHRPELDEQQQHQQPHTSSQPANSQHNSRRSSDTPVYRQLQQSRPNVQTQPTNASFPQQQQNFPGANPPPQNTARGRTRPNVQQMLQQPLRQVPTQLQHNFPLPTDFNTGGGKMTRKISLTQMQAKLSLHKLSTQTTL